MNIILSLLFAIKLFNPIPIELPDLETSYNDIKNNYKVIECIDDDNRNCLWYVNYYTEKKLPYHTIFYFNDDNKLIQISITFFNPVDTDKIFHEHLGTFSSQFGITTDENDHDVLNFWCCQPYISTRPPKSGCIPKLPELKVK